MTWLNLALGLAAMAMWLGVFGYYFRHDIRNLWTQRNDKWFRSEE